MISFSSAAIQRPDHVVVHPLVLLSVVDHYRRSALNTKKRVLGVLLGYWIGQTIHITNSYAGIKMKILNLLLIVVFILIQFPLKKMNRNRQFGFLIIIIMKT